MAKLHSVPDTAPRALGLVRVSKERGEMIAPELQWTAIEDHCARSGYQLLGRVEALDESGSQRRSPWWARLDQAVADVEAGQYDVIVVWKFSRTARQRLRWAVAIDRVEVAGGRLESATEAVDVSTSTGRFTRGMLAELAAFEAERIGDVWREVHARRTKAGLPANGKPRFGYVNVDGIHRPDPDTGPVLVDLYRRYIAGESQYSLVTWLNQQGIRTVPGYSKQGPGPWSINSLRQMLDSGFGAGFITVAGSREPGAHEPVISPETWTAYQAARAVRRPLKRAERSPYLLSGLVWCACGSKMGCGQWGRTPRAGVRCLRSTGPGAERHPGNYVKLALVEQSVFDWLVKHAADAKRGTDAALAQRAKSTRRRQDAKQLARQVIELDKAISRLTVNHAKGLVPDVAYTPALEELAAERAQMEERRIIAEAESTSAAPRKIAADLVRDWDLLPVEARRDGLRRLGVRFVVDGAVKPPRVVVTDATGDNTL